MPNYCRNEVNFYFYYNETGRIEELLEFLKETIANFNERLENARIQNQKDKQQHQFYRDEKLERKIIDFNNLFPYPEKYKQRDRDKIRLSDEEFNTKYGDVPSEMIDGQPAQVIHVADGYNSGGYEWCCRNWGTKWNAINPVWVVQHKTLYFDTAYGPVFNIISEIHKLFPDALIQYEYYERGVGFNGGCEYIPENWWDPSDYTIEEVQSIEQRIKCKGLPPETKWEAGKAYNPWSMDYIGFKGG